MTDPDALLDKRIHQTEKRLNRVKRKKPGSARVTRLERRHTRLKHLRTLPASQRPQPVRLDMNALKTALDAAQLVLAATPVGPALGAVKLGLGAAKGLGKALAAHDPADTMDSVLALVQSELKSRGVAMDEDDDALASLLDSLEDQLDPA
ncbi:MAG: hypothetical protein H6738_12920 [Alphaproteobacteria bacterium]|nr:hypothetical protein [Alphaproteobacteria bacterium]MCB9697677.1 hypothetical protein [Alphaproteobacteria bacterium]